MWSETTKHSEGSRDSENQYGFSEIQKRFSIQTMIKFSNRAANIFLLAAIYKSLFFQIKNKVNKGLLTVNDFTTDAVFKLF